MPIFPSSSRLPEIPSAAPNSPVLAHRGLHPSRDSERELCAESPLLQGRATSQGTTSRRRRPLGKTGLFASPFGFGGYRLRASPHSSKSHAEARDAVRLAIHLGCNVFDTAAHYGNGEAQAVIGEALQEAVSQGRSRSEWILLDRVAAPRSRTAKYPNLQSPFDLDSMRAEILESCRKLSVATLDGVFVHHPERLWNAEAPLKDNLKSWVAVLQSLETLRAEGLLQFYGLHSPFLLASPLGPSPWVPLEGLVEAFETEVGPHGRSGFQLLSAPLNLLEPEALLATHQPGGLTLAEAADRCGMALITHRPLNALVEGELIRLTSFPSFDLDTVQEELGRQLEESVRWEEHPHRPSDFPRLTHAIQRELSFLKDPGAWREALTEKILPTLERWREVILQGRDERGLQELAWFSHYMNVFPNLLTSLTRLIEGSASLRSQRLSSLLDEAVPALKNETSLSSRCLRVLENATGIGTILLGMRSPAYVREAFATRDTLTPEEVMNGFYTLHEDQTAAAAARIPSPNEAAGAGL